MAHLPGMSRQLRGRGRKPASRAARTPGVRSVRAIATLIPLYQSGGVGRYAFRESSRHGTPSRARRRPQAPLEPAKTASRPGRLVTASPVRRARRSQKVCEVWDVVAGESLRESRRAAPRSLSPSLQRGERFTCARRRLRQRTARRLRRRNPDQPPSASSGEPPWPGARTTTGVPTRTRL